MKPIDIKLSKELRELNLHCLSDKHIGDPNCDYKSVVEEVEAIAADPNAYVILGGDLLNNSTTSSIGDTYSEKIPPMEQIGKAVELLEPIKDRIIAVWTGNHELRTYRTDGIDMTRIICRQLGVEERYRPEGALIFLRFGEVSRRKNEGRRMTYTIYGTHGSRGGRKIGGKANALADEALICDADIFFVAHTHQPLVFKDRFMRTYANSGGVEFVDRLFINTSAALDFGGYAQRAGYQPASKANPVVHLCGTKRKMEATL